MRRSLSEMGRGSKTSFQKSSHRSVASLSSAETSACVNGRLFASIELRWHWHSNRLIYTTMRSSVLNALHESRHFGVAARMRAYADVMESSGRPDMTAYAHWLQEKADWIDPTNVHVDPIPDTFGNRDLSGSRKPNVDTLLPYDMRCFFEVRGAEPDRSPG